MGLAGLTLLVVALLTLGAWSSPTSNAEVLRQGDTNCDQVVNATDALGALQVAADVQPTPICAFAGDIDCSGEVDVSDAIGILRYAAGLPAASGAAAQSTCPPINAPIGTTTPAPATATPTVTASGSPTQTTPNTPTPTVTPTDTPTTCSGPGGGASLPPAPGPTSPPSAMSYNAQQVISAADLGPAASSAIQFAVIPGRPAEAIIALQSGYLYRVSLNGSFSPSLWGDVHTLVTDGGEQGLLSFAFSPDYQQDCRVYLYYTPGSPTPTVLSRFTASPTNLDESSEEVLIRVEEFATNHNGGDIIFDDAGYMYLSLGDGGGGGDPRERGQDLTTLLGKVIRIDVSGATGYTIPSGNPFTGSPCATPSSGHTCSAIFAYGFRNPFRMNYDSMSGQLWLGDVGQNLWEEVDLVTIGGNFGWDCFEGNHAYDDQSVNQGYTNAPCNVPTVAPRAEYDHDEGSAVTGGLIYRGDDMPELYGYYVYSDFYTGHIWAVNTNDNSAAIKIGEMGGPNPSQFILGADGEIYILSYSDGLFQLARD